MSQYSKFVSRSHQNLKILFNLSGFMESWIEGGEIAFNFSQRDRKVKILHERYRLWSRYRRLILFPFIQHAAAIFVFYVVYIISPLEGHRSTYGEGTEAFWKAECTYLSLWKLRTQHRTSAVASVRPCCGTPCVWPCVSQSLREGPAVYRRPLTGEPQSFICPRHRGQLWINEEGLTPGGAWECSCWDLLTVGMVRRHIYFSSHNFCPFSRVDVTFIQLLCHRFPSILIHVVLIESFLINLFFLLLYSSHCRRIHLIWEMIWKENSG